MPTVVDSYTPSTALSSYFPAVTSRSTARLWAVEKMVHDMSQSGMLEFFEGPGPNPTLLSGFSSAKIWLKQSAGVRTTSGSLRYYSGSGSTSDEANWPALTPTKFAQHIGQFVAGGNGSDYPSKAAAELVEISASVNYVRTAGYAAPGDGGGATYKRISTPSPVELWHFQSADGAYWEIADRRTNVLMFGADYEGVDDSAAAFTGAAEFGRLCDVPAGAYKLNSAPTIGNTGVFRISPEATFTGAGTTIGLFDDKRGFFVDKGNGANISRVQDRLFVGAQPDGKALGGNGTYLVGTIGRYFERSATIGGISRFGGIGVLGATRVSDRYATVYGTTIPVWLASTAYVIGDRVGSAGRYYECTVGGTSGTIPPTHISGTATDGTVTWQFLDYSYTAPIGLTGVVYADAADGNGSWASYIEGIKAASGATVYGCEIAMKNAAGSNIINSPYARFPAGSTIGHWFAGGGDPATGIPSTNPATCAIVIGRGNSVYGWNKGIVFQSDGLTGADGSTGTATAIEMGKGQLLAWRYSATDLTYSAMIRSDGASAATQQRLVFSTGSFAVKGVEDDFTTETTLFNVVAPALGVGESTNYLSLTPSATGAGLVTLQVAGADTNIDLRLLTKGSGLLRLSYATTGAATPGSFAANRIMAFKDGTGTTYYLPCMATTW